MSDMKFEKAIEKLEGIIEDLENQNVSLDDSLKKYEEGIKLIRTCTEKLEKARKRVEVLVREAGGFDLKALDGEGDR